MYHQPGNVSRVRFTWLMPSRLITHRSRRMPRLARNAIFDPSGNQAGSYSWLRLSVTLVRFEPAGDTSQMSPPPVKAISMPSGDHSGSSTRIPSASSACHCAIVVHKIIVFNKLSQINKVWNIQRHSTISSHQCAPLYDEKVTQHTDLYSVYLCFDHIVEQATVWDPSTPTLKAI
jgi:hypothetical protein